MPNIADAIYAASNLKSNGYIESDPVARSGSPSLALDYDPGRNSMIRCPMPPLWEDSSDAQRQFYVGDKIPQMRFMTPNSSNPNGALSGGNFGVVVTGNGTSGGGTTPATIAAAQAVVTTPVLPPNTRYVGSLSMSKSFQLLSIAASYPCRIQFYGNAAAQSQDVSRALDTPPPAGITQNIIADVVLDTEPLQWSFQDRVGSNADQPQQPVMYVTVTNLDVVSDAITLTLQYVPLENT